MFKPNEKIKFEERIPEKLKKSNITTSKELIKSLNRLESDSNGLRNFAYLDKSEVERLQNIIPEGDDNTKSKFDKAIADAANYRQNDISRLKLFEILKLILPGLILGGGFIIIINFDDFFESDNNVAQLANLPEKDKNTVKEAMQDKGYNAKLFDDVVANYNKFNPKAEQQVSNKDAIKLQPVPNAKSNPQEILQQLTSQVKSEGIFIDKLIDNFNQAYKNHYDYTAPNLDSKNNAIKLKFPTKSDMDSFFKEQAKNGIPFVTIDGKTGEVTSISTGDGNLYKPDGSKFGPNDTLKSTGVKYDSEFKLPEGLSSEAQVSKSTNLGMN